MEWIHEGVTIQIEEKGLFVYRLGEEPPQKFEALREAREAITQTKNTKRHSVSNAINLSALSRTGEPVTLQRIHESTGDWLTEPKEVLPPYYVNEPGVAELLKRIQRLEKITEIAEIQYKRIFGRSKADQINTTIASFRAGIEAAKTRWAKRPADNLKED
mgnify:CR=1 FL=1